MLWFSVPNINDSCVHACETSRTSTQTTRKCKCATPYFQTLRTRHILHWLLLRRVLNHHVLQRWVTRREVVDGQLEVDVGEQRLRQQCRGAWD